RAAIRSSPASRSWLTPPAASSASPRSTPTPQPNPPRQRSKAKFVQSWVGQPFLAVPYFFGHATSFNSSAKSPPLNFYFSFRLSTSLCSRSEEHTSELQSRVDLVCRLLLEK